MPENNVVIFGAGKIGRSFIGQLFGRQGYRIIFVDADPFLVNELNHRKEYPVVIKAPDHEERMVVSSVQAIHASEEEAITEAVSEATIMAVSVGKTALPAIAPVVARGLLQRNSTYPGRVLDMILAENMRSAAGFFRERLREQLPVSYPLDRLVGLVETSIGKMVPIMTGKELEQDPLQVFAEPYNTLILDRKGFKGEIPPIPQFSLKDHMKAWVDRKAFIHNLGHATAAYAGFLKNPEARFMFQVLEDPAVLQFTREVMGEAARALLAEYPGEFTPGSLGAHAEELLDRFRNRNLGDTVFRVGCDLRRKLGKDDRFMGAIRMARKHGLPFGKITEAMARGFLFRAVGEDGALFPNDVSFHRMVAKDLDGVLHKVCGLEYPADREIIESLKTYL
jgi:mannitol-1-phosphate 5-dehydrogenase